MADSAWQPKLQRARHHERDLTEALNAYIQLDPFALTTMREGNDLVVRLHIQHQIPDDLSLIARDLLHNARSALDLLVTSAARSFAAGSGHQFSTAAERKLSFPITRTESDFKEAAKKLRPYLAEETLRHIQTVQPWVAVTAWLVQQGETVTADKLNQLTLLDLLWRLSQLDNLDKHRDVLTLDFHRATITLGETDVALLDDGTDHEPRGEPITSLDDLDPATREDLIQSILQMQEYNRRPDSFDYYDAGDFLSDGAEIGRFIRNDGGPVPDDRPARGNLRLVLWEPEVMQHWRGSAPVQKTVRQMIDEVERVCTFIDSASPRSA